MSAIEWREPLWLLLALQPLLMWLPAWRRARRQAQRQLAWIDAPLRPWVLIGPSAHPRRWTAWLIGTRPDRARIAMVLAWLLFALAAAGPRLPPIAATATTGANQDLVLLLDLSRSMAATDIAPSRLRRVPIEIQELLRRAPAARVAVLVYAGRPHVLVPPTDDHQALAFYLRQIGRVPLPTAGSNAASALQQALDTATRMRTERQASAGTPGTAAVLWLTDGDLIGSDLIDSNGARPELEAAVAGYREAGIKLAILGLGTVGGVGIPLPDGGWLEQDGRAVVSRMDAGLLQGLADLAGGAYSPVRDNDHDWRLLYDQHVAAGNVGTGDTGQAIQWRELYPWLLAPGLALLLLATLWAGPSSSRLLLLPLCAGLLLSAPPRSAQASAIDEAYRLYSSGEFDAAATAYAGIHGWSGRIGEGSSDYRAERFAQAGAQFARALLLADNDRDRGAALYNLGNALFRQGLYDQAGTAFGDALRYHPTLEHGQFNHHLSLALGEAVRAEIDRRRRSGLAGTTLLGGRVEAEIEPGDLSTVSEGPSTMPDIDERLPDLPPDTRQRMQELIARGLARVITSPNYANADPDHTTSASGNQDRQSPRARQDRAQARLRMADLQDRQHELWKRLFEMEEGFPAALSEPRELPGVAPW